MPGVLRAGHPSHKEEEPGPVQANEAIGEELKLWTLRAQRPVSCLHIEQRLPETSTTRASSERRHGLTGSPPSGGACSGVASGGVYHPQEGPSLFSPRTRRMDAGADEGRGFLEHGVWGAQFRQG